MANLQQIKRDLCWYGGALLLAASFVMVTGFTSFSRPASGLIFGMAFLVTTILMLIMTRLELWLGAVAFGLSALFPLRQAFGGNFWSNQESFRLMGLIYLLGFVYIAVPWIGKLAIDWLDDRERRKFTKRG